MKVLFLILSLIITTSVWAHSGRTDSEGGHTCRTNCIEKWGLEYGEYHFHEKKVKGMPEVRDKARREARSEY